MLAGAGFLVAGWSLLFALFFFSPVEYGAFPDVSSGMVLGASARRFELGQDDVLITSRRAKGSYESDIALIVETDNHAGRTVFVIRNNAAVLLEQRIGAQFDTLQWDEEENRFIVSSFTEDALWLVPGEEKYVFTAAE